MILRDEFFCLLTVKHFISDLYEIVKIDSLSVIHVIDRAFKCLSVSAVVGKSTAIVIFPGAVLVGIDLRCVVEGHTRPHSICDLDIGLLSRRSNRDQAGIDMICIIFYMEYFIHLKF